MVKMFYRVNHPFNNIVIVQFKLALDLQLLCSLHVLKGYQVFYTMCLLLVNALILFFKFLLVVQMGEEYYHARDFSKALM